MVQLTDLLLPILLSGVAVFFLSFMMWMVLPHHRKDFSKLPDEDGTMAALADVKSGEYTFPHCSDPSQMKDPEWVAKRDKGPAGFLTIFPRGPISIGKSMGISATYNVVVALFVAYMATMGLSTASEGSHVFRFVATAAFMGFGLGVVWDSIWFGRAWSSTFKTLGDSLVYGLATGAIFMAMWPSA